METRKPYHCRANPEQHGYEASLIFAHRNSLRNFGLHSSNHYNFLLNGTHSAVALDYYFEQNTYFYSDVSDEAIYIYKPDEHAKPEVLLEKGLKTESIILTLRISSHRIIIV